MPNLDTLGARIKYFREKLGLSQDELALRVGATQQSIQSLETGKTKKSNFLPHIAKVLGIDIHALLDGSAQLNQLLSAPSSTIETARKIPLFSTQHSDLAYAYLKDQTIMPPTGKWVAVDASLPFLESGPRLFALKLNLGDEAFKPEFRPGDQLIVDPDAPLQPSDLVIVYKKGADRLIPTRYRVITVWGTDVEFQLVSIHPDFPSFAKSELDTLEIMGSVTQMRRPISARVRLTVLEDLSK